MSDEDPRGALVYSSAIRGLDQQADSLESLHGRAGILLSSASVTTLFLASIAIGEGEGLGLYTWPATIMFGGVLAFCVLILLPTGKWRFRPYATKLLTVTLDADPPPSLTKMHHDLSEQMAKWSEDNQKKLDRRSVFFSCACIAFALETGLWTTDLVMRG